MVAHSAVGPGLPRASVPSHTVGHDVGIWLFGVGFWVLGFGFWVLGLGFGFQGFLFEIMIDGSTFRIIV